jgi:hypothetical protein
MLKIKPRRRKMLQRVVHETADISMKVIGLNMDHVVRALPNLTLKQKIDLGAHVRSLLKLCEAVDGSIKGDIKTKLHNKGGVVNGETFKAVLAYHEEKRLDTAALKGAKPNIYKQFLKDGEVGVIKYEAR